MGDQITQVTMFRCLGSHTQNDDEINENVAHRTQAEWFKWRKVTKMICDQKVSNNFKEKFYWIVIKSMLCDSECWALNGQQDHKVRITEIMLKWICEHRRKYKLQNEHIQEKVVVAFTEEMIVENHLK